MDLFFFGIDQIRGVTYVLNIRADRHLYGRLIICLSINETIEIDIEEGRLDAVRPSNQYLVIGQAILEKIRLSMVLIY